jgi:hypothetical protein
MLQGDADEALTRTIATIQPRSQYWRTLIACAMVGVFCVQRNNGFALFVMVPFVAYLSVKGGYLLFTDLARARVHVVKLALWLGAIACCVTVHVYYAHAARADADALITQIENYRTTHGKYPASLDALDSPITPDDSSGLHSSRLSYFCHAGEPSVFYPATFIVFDVYTYDFAQRQWDYQAD